MLLLKTKMGTKEECFRLRLRDAGAWWCDGTVEEMFAREELLRKVPGGPTLPLNLESKDEILFKIVD